MTQDMNPNSYERKTNVYFIEIIQAPRFLATRLDLSSRKVSNNSSVRSTVVARHAEVSAGVSGGVSGYTLHRSSKLSQAGGCEQ